MGRPLFSLLFDGKKFERRGDPVAPLPTFIYRVLIMALIGILLTGLILGVGMAGYHYLADLSWVESFLNASMILSGMGEIDSLPNTAAKIFAATYALFSGLVFAAAIGVLFVPVVHRLYHKFHVAND